MLGASPAEVSGELAVPQESDSLVDPSPVNQTVLDSGAQYLQAVRTSANGITSLYQLHHPLPSCTPLSDGRNILNRSLSELLLRLCTAQVQGNYHLYKLQSQ